MADSTSAGQELANSLKQSLQGWREILAASHQVFIWKESFHPGVIAAAVTSIFLTIWISDASVLTTLSLLAAIVTIADYVVPLAANSYFDPSKWNDSKEEAYDTVCAELASSYLWVTCAVNTVKRYKEESPKIYFGALVAVLLTLAWLGNVLNNLFLIYLTSLFVALLPGLRHHGIIQQYTSLACTTLKGLIAGHLPAALGGGAGPASANGSQNGERKNK